MEVKFAARRADDVRLVAGVSAAHFVSHYYMLALPPLFAFVRADYGVSYTELGLALTVFNAVSALLQTLTGFLADRFNARHVLIAGLLCGAVAFAVTAAVDSFWVLLAMFGLMGLGNTVYHPADYALLSRYVSPERLVKAYSVHTFAGLLGTAVAPASLLFMHSLIGWRGAFAGAAILGFAIAAVLMFQRPPRPLPKREADKSKPPQDTSWRLLLSAPILINFVVFTLLGMVGFGIQNFSVVALTALHGTPALTANTALTGYLTLAAFGVLLGGWLASRSHRHALVAAAGMLAVAATCVFIASMDLNATILIMTMSLAGLFGGAILPSRDMLVRQLTPPGAFGKVFGFVTNGFNIAGIISPLLCGWLMDRGEPRLVFLSIAACGLLAIVAVFCLPKRAPAD
jgi:MFS family permease